MPSSIHQLDSSALIPRYRLPCYFQPQVQVLLLSTGAPVPETAVYSSHGANIDDGVLPRSDADAAHLQLDVDVPRLHTLGQENEDFDVRLVLIPLDGLLRHPELGIYGDGVPCPL